MAQEHTVPLDFVVDLILKNMRWNATERSADQDASVLTCQQRARSLKSETNYSMDTELMRKTATDLTGRCGSRPWNRRILPPGVYTWDVVALDNDGTDVARRGKRSFRIRPGAAELPWIEPKELLRRVPREHPRLLYLKAHLESIRSTLATYPLPMGLK